MCSPPFYVQAAIKVRDMMSEAILSGNLPLVLAAWAIIYIADYYGTLYTARLYQAYGREYISFGGSLELNPQFQHDIDRLRAFSPRFFLHLVLSLASILFMWLLCKGISGLNWFFVLFVGNLMLPEAVILTRHLRNLVFFTMAKRPGALVGRIEYSRPVALMQSETEMLGFALLFLFMSILTGSWFILGGAFGCAMAGLRHSFWAKKST